MLSDAGEVTEHVSQLALCPSRAIAAGKKEATVTYNLFEVRLKKAFALVMLNLFLLRVKHLLYSCVLWCSSHLNLITTGVQATLSEDPIAN